MAQFDVYRLSGGQLVVDLQTDLIGIDSSRVVAPLREAGRYQAFPGLTPQIDFENRTWIVRVQELAAVPGVELQVRVGSLVSRRDDLKRALDILLDGVWYLSRSMGYERKLSYVRMDNDVDEAPAGFVALTLEEGAPYP